MQGGPGCVAAVLCAQKGTQAFIKRDGASSVVAEGGLEQRHGNRGEVRSSSARTAD